MMVTQSPAGTTAEDLNRVFKDVSALTGENHGIEIGFGVAIALKKSGGVTGIVCHGRIILQRTRRSQPSSSP